MQLHWHIITHNQNRKKEALDLANLVLEGLPGAHLGSLDGSYRFENAYEIHIYQDLEVTSIHAALAEIITYAASIVMPWHRVSYHPDELFELIFEPKGWSNFTKEEFHHIRWIHAKITSPLKS